MHGPRAAVCATRTSAPRSCAHSIRAPCTTPRGVELSPTETATDLPSDIRISLSSNCSFSVPVWGLPHPAMAPAAFNRPHAACHRPPGRLRIGCYRHAQAVRRPRGEAERLTVPTTNPVRSDMLVVFDAMADSFKTAAPGPRQTPVHGHPLHRQLRRHHRGPGAEP